MTQCQSTRYLRTALPHPTSVPHLLLPPTPSLSTVAHAILVPWHALSQYRTARRQIPPCAMSVPHIGAMSYGSTGQRVAHEPHTPWL
eukprot:575535-Rhodomonas_salina.1